MRERAEVRVINACSVTTAQAQNRDVARPYGSGIIKWETTHHPKTVMAATEMWMVVATGSRAYVASTVEPRPAAHHAQSFPFRIRPLPGIAAHIYPGRCLATWRQGGGIRPLPNITAHIHTTKRTIPMRRKLSHPARPANPDFTRIAMIIAIHSPKDTYGHLFPVQPFPTPPL